MEKKFFLQNISNFNNTESSVSQLHYYIRILSDLNIVIDDVLFIENHFASD